MKSQPPDGRRLFPQARKDGENALSAFLITGRKITGEFIFEVLLITSRLMNARAREQPGANVPICWDEIPSAKAIALILVCLFVCFS